MAKRDEFSPKTIRSLQKRAAFICSNPDCQCLTIAPSEENETDYIYIGHASHISAASKGGPRYDATLTSNQRKNISNAIFLCASCATVVDKNNGADFTQEELKLWKKNHESWVRKKLNKKPVTITEIDGTHEAIGVGDVAGLRISKSVKIKPGTISRAAGVGKVSGTSIE